MPKIDTREFQVLLDEKKAMVPLYTPEWDISDEKDVGAALLKIFTHMQMEIINRLNRVPDKHFTAFLELLGINLMPAQPARVPVTFYLSKKHSGGVFVPQGTKVATEETDKHGALVFETVKGFYAVDAAIKEVYCADPEKDEIFCYSDDLSENKEFKLFEGDNLQEHVLYLGHDEYFNLKEPTKIELQFTFIQGSVEDLANYIWEYWDADEDNPVQFGKEKNPNNNIIILKSKGEIKKEKIYGIESHWIHCRRGNITGNIPVIEKIKIKNVAPTQPIQPNLGFYNGIPLDVTKEFYPFSKQPRLYDAFYLGSKEAFSKKNAIITIIFRREGIPDPVPNNVELLWEYWNGTIWQVLEKKKDNLENFVLQKKNGYSEGYIEFNCPDIKEKSVGGQNSFWIRVRLIEGDYGKEEIKSEKPLLFSIPYQENIQIPDGLKQGFTDNEIYLSELINTNEITTGKWIIVDYETNNVYFVEKDNSHLNVYRKVTWAAIPNFKPPVITGIDIKYSFNLNDQKNLQYCLAYNNLKWRDFTQESNDNTGFKPFIPLPENHPTIYLGFNNAFKKGNISIFFSLVDELFSQVTGAKVQWSYWKRAPNLYKKITNARELHLISTEGISKGVELILEETIGIDVITQTVNIQSCSDKEIALDRELDFYYSKAARVMQRNHLEVFDHTEYITKNGTLEFIGPADHEEIQKFGKKKYWVAGTLTNVTKDYDPPLIKGIYPNTVWAEQVETIKDEILGSGDGKKDRSYQFTKSPIISPEVWVMEGKIIPEDEKKNLSQDRIREIRDNTGKVKETWIKWKAVEDFTGSGPRSRDYMMDCSMGMMTFGDGEKGMIPPIGKDNIRADYKSGGGVEGNLPVNEITVLKSPAGGIDHIINHEPSEGGSDTELLEEVFERGPHLIKHRDRAVTREDFERLAREASNYIARTKCVPEGNTLYIIIIPKGEEDKPLPSRGLKEIVKNHLLSRRLNLISAERIQIEAPSYVEVQVKADIIPESIEDAVPLEKEILKRLRAYFHPLTGGNERRGWEFGRDVHISDVYAMLEGIDGVDHVENLELNVRNTDVNIDKMKTACTGQHRITMKLGVTQ